MERRQPRDEIRDLPFRHNTHPRLGFEILRLSSLFARAERNQLGHSLAAPQRPEFHTVYVGLRGRGELMVDFAPVPIGEGLLTIVARGRVQSFAPASDVEAAMLVFSPEFLAPDPRGVDVLRAAAVLAPTWAHPVLEIPASEQRDLAAIIAQIDREHEREPDAFQAALLLALLRTVLLRAERLAADAALAAGKLPPPAELERFFTTLEADHARTRSVAHYAKAAALSPRRLNELLAIHTGRGAKQLISERVTLEAKRLLAHTDVSVKELAERLGFGEPTNLVKFFRLHTGTTPLGFRAEQRAI
jgi:AraC family transcriptional activator of pobA